VPTARPIHQSSHSSPRRPHSCPSSEGEAACVGDAHGLVGVLGARNEAAFGRRAVESRALRVNLLTVDVVPASKRGGSRCRTRLRWVDGQCSSPVEAKPAVHGPAAHQPGLRERPNASADHEATLASSGATVVAWYGAKLGRDEADDAEAGRSERADRGVSRAAACGAGGGGGATVAASSWAAATCSLLRRPMRSCSAPCTEPRWAAAGPTFSESRRRSCSRGAPPSADSSSEISAPIT